MSAAPLAASSASDSQNTATARTQQKRPNSATADRNGARPAGRRPQRQQRRHQHRADRGRARTRRGPGGPTCRISSAKIGRRATAPPNSTANRSSVIAPRKTGRLKRNVSRPVRWPPAARPGPPPGAPARRIPDHHDERDAPSAPPRSRRTRGAEPGVDEPPIAGPVTAATCQMPVRQATALGNSGRGTSRRRARCAPAAGSCARRRTPRSRRRRPADQRLAPRAEEPGRSPPAPARRGTARRAPPARSAYDRGVGDVPGVKREAMNGTASASPTIPSASGRA